MDWQHPPALYLIVPVILLWNVLALHARGKRRRAARAFVDAAMQPRILPAESNARFWTKTLLLDGALALGILALAGPRFGVYYETIKARGSDLYVIVDVSRSMLATDVPPSRLARAKADVASLLSHLNGERVGLIAFAGVASVKCPLTTDYGFFRLALDELDPNSVTRGGTAIGDAVRKALDVLPKTSERDEAILLITDGEDQDSYPLEAAAAAAERHVVIFTVGLGDELQGARIPVDEKGRKEFVSYQGKDVVSKLDNSLLQEMALRTGGAHIPAGTKAYDLGQLYADHLAKLKGAEGAEQKRERRTEQYQWFLGAAILCLLADLLISLYPTPAGNLFSSPSAKAPQRAAVGAAVACLLFLNAPASAADPADLVREGIDSYKKNELDAARFKFSQAQEESQKSDDRRAQAVSALDLGIALQKKGDAEHARENYMTAAMSADKQLAATAHFNLGNLAAEKARSLAGEFPEKIEAEKRKEILDKLKEASGFYRNALDASPAHAGARKNLELLRQWVKLYTDRWRQADKQKKRDETDLLGFLDFLIETQTALRQAARPLSESSAPEQFGQLRQSQEELAEEIGPLKEKIRLSLLPPPQPGAKSPPPMNKQMEEALNMLQSWAGMAGEKMHAAAEKLEKRQPSQASVEQTAALDELERLWDAVVTFHPLLARDLEQQTKIAEELKPGDRPRENASSIPDLIEKQDKTARRTELLKFKAEALLDQLEKIPAQPAKQPQAGAPPGPKTQVDPVKLKIGLRKAVELAPKAVEKMNAANSSLRAQKPDAAYPDAEEARKILEEIAKSQPQDPNQNDQNQQNKDQKDQNKKDQQNKDNNEQQKKKDSEQQKKDSEQKKKDEQKKDSEQQKKDEEKKKQEQQKKSDEEKNKDEKNQAEKQKAELLTKEQAEDLLRKVREREVKRRNEKNEERIRMILKMPKVEKDW